MAVAAERWDAPFEDPPENAIREEIFSVERLEGLAQALAADHLGTPRVRFGRSLAPRVRENGRVLARCQRELAEAAALGRPVPPAARALLGNFHLVSDLDAAIREELPSAYYRGLPKLGHGGLRGFPRIYALAWNWVAHCDSHFDAETLLRFVAAYQRAQPLMIGELWALPITLRMVLLENLRRQARAIVVNLRSTGRADRLADLLLGLGPGPVLSAALARERLGDRMPPLAFSARLQRRLGDQDASVGPMLAWLSERLGVQGTTPEAAVRRDHQEQATRNATCENVIASLRAIALYDWPSFVERLSLVDGVFEGAFDFAGLNFATRDRYRHAIEDLARGSRHGEVEVARLAARAGRAGEVPPGDASCDVGECLIGPAREAFERRIGYGPSLRLRLGRAVTSFGAPFYLGSLGCATVGALAWPLGASTPGGGGALTLGVALLALLPASEIAVALVNHAVMALWRPHALPALSLKGGVPESLRTVVAVPVILPDNGDFQGLMESLEVHFFANPEGDLHFALLTDWADAPGETLEGEDRLLADARERIGELNRRHGAAPGGGPRFGLYHRRRRYNARDRVWMGWERKRGKLMEFNRLLRGAPGTSFTVSGADAPAPPTGVRYVITLDHDTRLPRGAARRLVGAMAHPLNRPVLNASGDRVIRGYGILQPRISPILPFEEESTWLNRLGSGRAGSDPYVGTVSEVYQDLFGEGSYAGKGIYDVDAFEACLAGRVPDNALLSHDLFEGSFARAGLVSDIELFESLPGHGRASAAREHRWTRGDWQLLPWILGFGAGRAARLGIVARWKMTDNLRRSLLPTASLALLCAAVFLPPGDAPAWSAFALAGLALPPLLGVLATELVPRGRDFALGNHWRSMAEELGAGILKFALSTALLPYDALRSADAVARALFRLFVSRRGLLEWTSSARFSVPWSPGRGDSLRRFAAGPLVGCAMLAGLALARPPAWPLGLALAALWLASPALGRWFDLPRPRRAARRLGPARVALLRRTARRTWHYFETFVDGSSHDLPPDNYQEDPRPALAGRTSPTNMGLYLLACSAARDFGWLTAPRFLDRLERTLDSMEAMEKCRGHFLNWYDVKSLRPLEPRFVSTVDSGNLAGHLLVARQSVLELLEQPLFPAGACRGLADSLDLAAESALSGTFERLAGMHRLDLRAALAGLAGAVREEPAGAAGLREQLGRIKASADTLADIAASVLQEHDQPAATELARWAGVLQREHDDLAALAGSPMMDLPPGFNPPLGSASEGLLGRGLEGPARAAAGLAGRARRVAGRLQALFAAMDFGFLYDPSKRLLSVGYRPAGGCLDAGCYGLLASEARLASFVAVARGDVAPEHWSRLGRPFTATGKGVALLSWSGSMFEYLMPLLVMRSPPRSLLADTYRTVVRRQRAFGKDHGVPWGVSESAYNLRDNDMTYQYSDFGVDGLGMKEGLGRQQVVAPYATALALMVDPPVAAENLERLASMGALGTYGFFDALDFGPDRLPEGRAWAVVRTHMAHHQGMTLIALLHVLRDGPMQARFLADPLLRSASLLLQERTPRNVVLTHAAQADEGDVAVLRDEAPTQERSHDGAHQSLPQAHLLGNGSYSVMLTSAGGGFSRWNHLRVTRFRPDPTVEAWGTFILIRDVDSGRNWSATYLPSRAEPDSYRVSFREDKAEFVRRDGGVETRLEVAVSPEDDVEVRRLTFINHGTRPVDLEATSYAEVSLSEEDADLAHQAFAKLFVETDYVPELGALLAHRRPRGSPEEEAWAAHLCLGGPEDARHETDRARFLGRGRDIFDPALGAPGALFTGGVGAVLDPIFSIRRGITVQAGGQAHVTFATMAASSRAKVLALAAKVGDGANVERLFGQARIHAQVQLRYRGIQPEEARLFQSLAGHLLYPDPRLRPPAELMAANRLGPGVLWSRGISGALPLLLLRMDEASDREILRQLVLAWEYWRLKNLAVDFVVLNEEPASYAAEFQRWIEDLARAHRAPGPGDRGGAIHVVQACLLPRRERDLLLCAARAVLHAGHGSLSEQLARVAPLPSPPPWLDAADAADCGPLPESALELANGLGGFAQDGQEYRVTLEEGKDTPAPWINVVANPQFGFQVSESGSGATWSGNSRENKLSPWSNDPVSDPAGEAFYVRDEDNGALFGPTAQPIRLRGGRYRASHGQGYSRFESTARGIRMVLTQFVPLSDPIKISRLVVENVSARPRRLSLTAYVPWVLGTEPQATAHTLVTGWDAALGLLTARNPFHPTHPEALAFLDAGNGPVSYTCDRREFLGRHGGLRRPRALRTGAALSGRAGAGLDPCACLRRAVDLEPGASAEFRVLLGQAPDRERLAALVEDYRARDLDRLLAEVRSFWDRTLGALTVRTPDRSMDLMLNRWLLYQTLSCRLWARTALYQCGGAYGFRDQLQDVVALAHSNPAAVRDHLLRAAGKQFKEGDVLHWWHPPHGAGVRTRITDDRLWLPYAVARYVDSSGDRAVLEEEVAFVEGPPLAEGTDDLYFTPTATRDTATLYEHCALALDRSLATGRHGLPLMGGGDWNDGMNRVGRAGRGESVWLAWFLVDNLRRFAVLARTRGERPREARWSAAAADVVAAVESRGWDGDWYRRAFSDDGTALGSAALSECRIDSIAQSWAVLSGAADPARAARAMAALEEHLWRKGGGQQVLLEPPFTGAGLDPGYIAGYPPGIRENGGQYNHAAAWAVAAFAGLGEGAKAHELFAALNPARVASTRAGMLRYRIEPYVMAGDVLSMPPHVGRGGWSWYTGSAAWMHRVGIESILGLTLDADSMRIEPCIPPEWPGFEIRFERGGTRWEIRVTNPRSVCRGVARLELDGREFPVGPSPRVPLLLDGESHALLVVLGPPEDRNPGASGGGPAIPNVAPGLGGQ